MLRKQTVSDSRGHLSRGLNPYQFEESFEYKPYWTLVFIESREIMYKEMRIWE